MTEVSDTKSELIEDVYEKWHQVLKGELEIDRILHEDCIFWSPVLFHPQHGRDLTKMYLSAASLVFPGDNTQKLHFPKIFSTINYILHSCIYSLSITSDSKYIF